MNILVTIYHGLGKGGAEVSVKALCESLKERGHNVFIASTEPYAGFKWIRLSKFRKWPSFLIKQVYLEHVLKKAIKQHNIDLVYPQDMYTTLGAIKVAKKEKKSIVIHLRDYWFACPRSSCVMPDYTMCSYCSYGNLLKCASPLRLPWEFLKLNMIKKCWKNFNDADCIFAATDHEESILREVGVKTKIVLARNARNFDFHANKAAVSAFKAKHALKGIVATFFGSLTYTKGAQVLLEIIPRVVEMDKNVQFLIAGDGGYNNEFIELSRKMQDSVILTGRLKQEEIPVLLASSDIVLFPSVWREPFGGAQLEAAAAKRAIIGDNVGGVRDKVFGIHISVKYIDKWAEKILYLAHNPKARARLAEIGFKNAKKEYNLKDYVDKIEQELEYAVKNSR